MKISDINVSSKRIDIEAKVIEKEEPRDIITKYGQTKVANAIIEDDTGRFKLTLWGEHADKVNEGDKIKITNGFVSTFRDELQLSVGKFGRLEIL
ncbi:MAG: DNA-binding protein [Candidatus Aenigmarchaeota archaeon]|nr:DNA-binding protein [Candidatus Aenigmarchaeota archaeon]